LFGGSFAAKLKNPTSARQDENRDFLFAFQQSGMKNTEIPLK